ncbi:MAG: hypothetical protein Q4C91_17605 [Eubacteriales bacterium]|nr:hypothetical protein [Eubacteriales bacterium]
MSTNVVTALKLNNYGLEILIIDCSKDDLIINDLAFLLGADRQGVCHEVIDEAWIATGVSVDSAKSSFADDAA